MRWGSSVVPAHLVSLSLQPHTFLSRLVFLLTSSSFCLCRAHIYTTVLALILFAPPRGGVRVCALVVTGILLNCERITAFTSVRISISVYPLESEGF